MRQRPLGSHGPTVGTVGFGCMGLTGSYGPVDEADAQAVLRGAVEAGVTLFDTADAYAEGDNERLVGRTLRPVRDRVVLATKFRSARMRDGSTRIDGSPQHVHHACDQSLRRLGIETIDLYFQHRVDRSVPIEETVGAMSELVAAGKVRHVGLCEAGVSTIERAHAVHPLAAVQTEYSLWSRDVEQRVLPTLQELGIGLVAYSPLGRGFLAGAVTDRSSLDESDVRRRQPRFEDDNLTHNLTLLGQIKAIAERNGATSSQIALAWVLAQGEGIVPIMGTSKPEHLQENLAAADLSLTDVDLAVLRGLAEAHGVAGPRYPEAAMTNIET